MNRAVKFLDQCGAEFWLDDRVIGASHARMIRYIRDEYAAQGSAALRETNLSLENFRSASASAMDGIDDEETYRILRFAVARVANYAHLLQLAQSLTIRLVRLVAVFDDSTSQICRVVDGQFNRTRSAVKAVPFAITHPLFPSLVDVQAAIGPDNILSDDFVIAGGIPPFHRKCRTRIEGVVPGIGIPLSGKEQARYDEWRRLNSDSLQ